MPYSKREGIFLIEFIKYDYSKKYKFVKIDNSFISKIALTFKMKYDIITTKHIRLKLKDITKTYDPRALEPIDIITNIYKVSQV